MSAAAWPERGFEVRDEVGNVLGAFDTHYQARAFARTVTCAHNIFAPDGVTQLGHRGANNGRRQVSEYAHRGSTVAEAGVIEDFDS